MHLVYTLSSRVRKKKPRGVETQGRGKHTIKPLPKQGFGPPPPMIRFPRPFVHALSFSLEATGTDQTNPTFSGLQTWFWSDTFCPTPPFAISQGQKSAQGDFAPPEPEFRPEFCETNFGRPNFGPEFLGRIF